MNVLFYELRKNKAACRKTRTAVPSHTYLAVRKSDDKAVGMMIDLRHYIEHSILDILCVLLNEAKVVRKKCFVSIYKM